jgi:hypothetical protein
MVAHLRYHGDGILAEFGSVMSAAECSFAIQNMMQERNVEAGLDHRMSRQQSAAVMTEKPTLFT